MVSSPQRSLQPSIGITMGWFAAQAAEMQRGASQFTAGQRATAAVMESAALSFPVRRQGGKARGLERGRTTAGIIRRTRRPG